MRTRAALGGAFASVVLMTLGWQLGTAAVAPSTSTTAPSASGTGSGSSGSSSGSGSTSASASGTYTGQSVSTRFGDVQVGITVSGGTVTDITALHLTDRDGRSVQISNRAAPLLRSEALQAQSASVQTVGGATYTSDAYLTSLQSALDQAGL